MKKLRREARVRQKDKLTEQGIIGKGVRERRLVKVN